MHRRICGKDFALGVFLFFILSGVGYAEIVRYYDDQGKVHYVNTDYGTVPVKYRDQIKSKAQVPAPVVKADPANEEKTPGKVGSVSPAGNASTMGKGTITVMVLSNGPLAPTDDLKLNLDSNKIAYLLYDINIEPGNTMYKNLGEGALPIVQVISTNVVRGGNMRDVLATINSVKSCAAAQ